MQRKIRSHFIMTGVLLLASVLFTVVVKTVDVQPIGPAKSCVGLAGINGWMLRWAGASSLWYHVTDCLGMVAILVAVGFLVLGLVQLIQRKSIKHVDANLIALGVFYVLVFAAYIGFDLLAVNYRPTMVGAALEASFPSSHTMIVFCILSTAMMQFPSLIPNRRVRATATALSVAVIAVTVIGRFFSGVHWFTDIIGGLLIGSTLSMGYFSTIQYIAYKRSCAPDRAGAAGES